MRIRKKIIPNRKLEMQEEMRNNEHGKSKVKLTVQNNTANIWYSLKYI